MKIDLLSLADPDGPSHGGTMRTRAFRDALSAWSSVSTIHPGNHMVGGSEGNPSRLRQLKRYFLPMPTQRRSATRELAASLSEDANWTIISALSHGRIVEAPAVGDVWYDAMDVWSQFCRVEARARPPLARSTALLQAQALVRQEEKLCAASSVITTAGWKDRQILVARGHAVTWLPTPIDDNEFAPSSSPGTKTAGFLGNFRYWPNVDALRLLAEWAPMLKSRGWRIVIAGRGADTLLDVPDGIENLGELEEVRDFYDQVDLSLSPIRLGGGIKVKVIESLAHSTPVLASAETLEGFPPDLMPGLHSIDAVDTSFFDSPPEFSSSDPRLQVFRFSSFAETLRTLSGDRSGR